MPNSILLGIFAELTHRVNVVRLAEKKKINKEGIFWEFCTELSGMIKPIESALHWENKEEENLGFSEGIIINDPTSREWVDSDENSKKSMVNF